MPRIIDLAVKLRIDPLMNSFHVRRFESSDQRRAGYLARQQLRQQRDAAQKTPEPDKTPAAALPQDVQMSPEIVETARANSTILESPVGRPHHEVLFDIPVASDIIDVETSVAHLMSLWSRNCPIRERYAYLRSLPTYQQSEVSRIYFEKTDFKLHV